MSYILNKLTSKSEIDSVIRNVEDKVVVLRFGKDTDPVCMQQDDILFKCERLLSKMAQIYVIDVDDVPFYCQYFDITYIPSTIFFFNAHHMKIDAGTPDHSKWVGAFYTKEDFIDLIETIYRGALYGHVIITSPIPKEHVTQYDLLYKDI
ncbi:hypothetical protein WA158_002768 [Blastocystis sp. Blastoise]